MLRSTRQRLIATATALAMAAGAFLVLTPDSQAADSQVHLVGQITSVDSPTAVFAGLTGQDAGTWTTAALPQVDPTSTDTYQMLIAIDDAAPDGNCATADHAIGFSAVPTVTNTTAGNAATFSAALTSTGTAAAGCLKAGVNDAVVITATHFGAAGAVLEIGGIKLDVGTLAVPGDVRFAVNSTTFGTACAAPNASDSCANATVSAVAATSSNALVLVPPTASGDDATGSAISPIIVKELRAGAADSGGVCVTLSDAPDGTKFDTTGSVGVTASGGPGEGTAAGVLVTPTSISFTTTLSTTATTYTIGGVALITGEDTGPVAADVTAGTCANQPPPTTTTTESPTSTSTSTSSTSSSTSSTSSSTSSTSSSTSSTSSSTSSTSSSTSTTAPTTTTTACSNVLTCLLQSLGLASTHQTAAVAATPAAVTTAAVTPAAALPAGTPYIRGIRLAFVGDVARVSGANRYATAAAIAKHLGDLSDKTVVIARGDNFPDALAASYLAGQDGGPILLTTPTSVPAETVEALAYGGATKVVLVGGTTSISTAVESYLSNLHTYDFGSSVLTDQPNDATLDVTRIGGADRYATAALVAEAPGLDQAGTIGVADGSTCDNDVTQAIVASGENFPDALAAGGLAYGGVSDDGCGGGPIPLLLTPGGSLSPATAIAIRDLGVKHVILMGGTATVSQAVQNALDNLSGVNVTRIAGATRQETAAKLANLVLGPDEIGAWNSGTFLVAGPDTFPDTLTASSLSGTLFAPLYLANSASELGTANGDAIVGYPQDFGHGLVIGGTSTLSGTVASQTATAIASQP